MNSASFSFLSLNSGTKNYVNLDKGIDFLEKYILLRLCHDLLCCKYRALFVLKHWINFEMERTGLNKDIKFSTEAMWLKS